MESKTNAQRFLDAYSNIEKKLSEQVKDTRYVPFSQLLYRCAKNNHVVSSNLEILREYNELRNAIVHTRGEENEIIAEPCDSVVENIERIQRLLSMDDSILNYACRPVKTVKLTDDIHEVFALMEKMGTSKIPVYEEETCIGILTMSMIAKWALHSGQEKGIVKQALICNGNEKVIFLPKNAHIQQVVRAFEKAMHQGNNLLAILISEHGKRNEKPIGIITLADMPKIIGESITPTHKGYGAC